MLSTLSEEKKKGEGAEDDDNGDNESSKKRFKEEIEDDEDEGSGDGVYKIEWNDLEDYYLKGRSAKDAQIDFESLGFLQLIE